MMKIGENKKDKDKEFLNFYTIPCSAERTFSLTIQIQIQIRIQPGFASPSSG